MSDRTRPLRSRFMGHDYRVVWCKPGSIHIEGTNCYGVTESHEQRIRMDGGLPPTREREVLIHELIHQIANELGWALAGDAEEEMADKLGRSLAAHIQDNPTFWRYVTRRLPTNE